MATTPIFSGVPKGVRSMYWDLVDGETGTGISSPESAPLALFIATRVTAGSPVVSIEVSADGVDWFPARDVQGTTANIVGAGFLEISTAALQIRAVVSGGNARVTSVMRG